MPTSRRVFANAPGLAERIEGGTVQPLIAPIEGSDLSLRLLCVAPSATARIGDEHGDQLLLTVEGSGQVVQQTDRSAVSCGTACHVQAGATAEIQASEEGITLLCAHAGSGCDRHAPLGDAEAFATVDSAEARAATGSRAFQVLFGPENGCERATLFVGHVPSGRAPWHFHFYDEIVWIWSGAGQLHLRDAGTVEPFEAGSAFRLRPGEVHTVENTGDRDLILIGVFTPAGSPSAAYYA